MPVVDALDNGCEHLDVKAAGLAHGYPALVDACLFAAGYGCNDLVAGLESEMTFLVGQVAAWEPVFAQPGALILPPPSGFDVQRRALPASDGINLANTDRIERVGFRDT